MKKIFQIVIILSAMLMTLASCRKKDDTVPVGRVDLSMTVLSVPVGGTGQLLATIYPEAAAAGRWIGWFSDNTGIATVDYTGLVKGISVGTTIVRITDESGKFYPAVCAVSVHEKNVPVTGIALNRTDATVSVNGSEDLNCTLVPTNASNKNVIWRSNDSSIATVDSNGRIVGISAGAVTVTVTSEDGNFTAACAVTVQNEAIPVTGISLDKTALSIYIDDVEELTAEISPVNATDKSVSWSSSDASVVTVNENGTVTGVSAGTATVSATSEDGEFTAGCTVTVTDESGSVTSTGWSAPTANSYEYSMTYVAQVAFRGVLSTETDIEVAAFVGNELRGHARPVYEPQLNMYLVHLTVFSNSAGGETVTLKAYRPSKQRIYGNCKEFTFHGNTSLGSASEILNCMP
jgi:uncharacterized protein YjdB